MPTCQICEREIKLKDGERIAHHGYQRPGEGWQTDSCRGARRLPWEVSSDALKEWVGVLESLRDRALALSTASVDTLYVRVGTNYRVKPNDPRRSIHETITEATLAEIVEKYPHMGAHCRGADHYRPPTWEMLVSQWRSDRAAEAERLASEIDRQRARLAAWRPAA